MVVVCFCVFAQVAELESVCVSLHVHRPVLSNTLFNNCAPLCVSLSHVPATNTTGNMQSAVDEKKKLELRVDNLSGELNKAKGHSAELEAAKQTLQVRKTTAVFLMAAAI